MSNFDDLLCRAPALRTKLEANLVAHGGNDVVVVYSDVALAFPASGPNSRSFDIPLIDSEQLKLWAAAIGWKAELISDMPASDCYPVVRFIKIR